ncbi:MAG TPA: hypothetical protein VFZ61_20575, partial [Polyangiales bacterium]
MTLGLLLGGTACKRTPSARCSLGEAECVAASAAARFDGVALAGRGEQALAAWSEPDGTFVRWIAKAKRPPLRVAERCAGGVALALVRDAAFLACLAPETGAYVVRLQGPGLEAAQPQPLSGPVGRDARGIALALQANGAQAESASALFVAWEDGEAGDPKVRLATLRGPASAGATPQLRTLSRPHANGHEPQLLWRDGELWAAWTESDLTPGRARHHVLLQRGSQPPVQLADTAGESPRPALGADSQGVVLAYRAARRAGQRGELWLGRVEESGRRWLSPARSIGRANGAQGPSLALCGATRAAAVPIDHAGELYVALHPLSAALETTEENHQYYESGR